MTFSLQALGDRAVLIHLGDRIDAVLNRRALAVAAAVRAATLPGVLDVAPAYASVCVHYEPLAWTDATDSRPPYARMAQMLAAVVESGTTHHPPHTVEEQAVDVPVCYGGDFGPDLDDVARHAQLDSREVIARHTAAVYTVAMLGFAPGFPYLLGLDAALDTPRRASPRTRVPRGSVAIGGAQTGIYPRQLPGGWNIIGATPSRMFDPARDPPALLGPGARVRFRAIGDAEFAALSR